LERSQTLHEESLELSREIEDTQGVTSSLVHLGAIGLIRGDYDGIPPLLEEALRLACETDFRTAIHLCFIGLGCVAAGRERPIRAARLWGVAEGMREAYGAQVTPVGLSVTNYEGRLAAARSQLDDEAWWAAWEEGKAMSLERAIEYALSTEEPSPPAISEEPQRAHTDEPADPLTRRQLEVALLIGRGLTNAQIADALTISIHTVANHVATILRKLDLPSRSKIVVWVTEKRLRDPE
ncbi:MAG: response regulator transcription factor, partial [Rubrobacter sp.]